MKRNTLLLLSLAVMMAASIASKAQSREVMILYNNAFVHQKEYRPDEAMKCLRLAIQLDSTFVPAYNLMGYIYEDAYVQYDSALMTYRKILDIDSNYSKAYVNIGHIFFLMKKYDEALKCNEKAVAVDPTYGDAYFNIGWIYNIRGDLEKSIEYIFRAAQFGSREAKEFLDRNGYNEDLQEDYSDGFNDDIE
ncbi:MAG: tetratricopeptide repeat protein [Bacteroidales bacterium]|nr:tetratricopeptide repeat protein [Bacteroidales bacterium]